MNSKLREKQITKTSLVGIGTNLLLVGFKAAVGLIAGSLAVVLDAVNNLTDAVSSVVSIVGIKLSHKAPTKRHPFGFGRVEYLSAVIVAAIIIATGVVSGVESVKKIITPESADYSWITITVVSVALVVKIALGLFVRMQGKKYHSDALVGSGTDALFDAVISASTLVGIGVAMGTGYNIDGIVGIIISLFIVKAGIDILLSPLGQMLGARPDSEATKEIRKVVEEVDGVQGAYDLILHNYGPETAIGSVHIDVPGDMTADEIHHLTQRVQMAVWDRFHVFLTVGIYAVNESDPLQRDIRALIIQMAEETDKVVNVHAIHVDVPEHRISFDLVCEFSVKNREEVGELFREQINASYPDFEVNINYDLDYSD